MAGEDWAGAVGEGLQSFMSAYKDERKRQEDAKDRDKKDSFNALVSGVRLNQAGGYEYTPEKLGMLEQEKQKGLLDQQVKQGEFDLQKAKNPYEIEKLKAEAIKARRDATKADGVPKERLAPAGELSSLGEADAAIGQLDDLLQMATENKQMLGPTAGLLTKVQGKIGYGEAGRSSKVVSSQLNTAAQEIGRYLEGGKLTDNDIARYVRDILPTPYDDEDTFRRKSENLQRRIAQKAKGKAAALDAGGYYLGNYKAPAARGLVQTPGAERRSSAGPKPGTIEGGFRFKGGDPSNPNSWEKSQ